MGYSVCIDDLRICGFKSGYGYSVIQSSQVSLSNFKDTKIWKEAQKERDNKYNQLLAEIFEKLYEREITPMAGIIELTEKLKNES